MKIFLRGPTVSMVTIGRKEWSAALLFYSSIIYNVRAGVIVTQLK